MRLYTARWLLPVSAPPVANGAVAVHPSGRIAYAGPAAGAPAGEIVALGDAVLLPGLVAVLPDAAAPPARGVTTVAVTAPSDVGALVASGRRVRVGVAVPPVYAVDENALLDLCAWAVGENLPLAIPAGVSAAEVAFIREASGPHADALRARGVDVVRRAHSTVHLLAELGIAAVARPLLVGGARFDESDVALAAYYDCPVAYAPPAEASTLPDPLAALLAAGVRVAIAAPDPLAAAHALGASPDAALHLSTLGGARALDLDAATGSFDVGKAADLCAFALTPGELRAADARGPACALATAAQRDPVLTLVDGVPLRPA